MLSVPFVPGEANYRLVLDAVLADYADVVQIDGLPAVMSREEAVEVCEQLSAELERMRRGRWLRGAVLRRP